MLLTQLLFCLQYIGNFTASKLELLKNFVPFLRKLAGIAAGTEVELYEEVKYLPALMITFMGDEAQATDFSTNSLDDGDILIIQESLSEVPLTYFSGCDSCQSDSERHP